jgi:hypothetical protein
VRVGNLYWVTHAFLLHFIIFEKHVWYINLNFTQVLFFFFFFLVFAILNIVEYNTKKIAHPNELQISGFVYPK